ncbi:radical SAM/SPASM domain-containing protein [Candidatus Omnitrophota bacterium]
MLVSEGIKKRTVKPGFCCYGIVDHCMLRCKMCYKWKEDIAVKNPRDVPSMRDWKTCTDSLREITGPGFLINFGGGEPLLKRDLLELVKHCKKKRFITNIATNAYLIDEDMARRIADSGLDSINVSLDSLDDKIHDFLRGIPGVFGRAMKAIEYLDRYCTDLEIIICSVIYDISQDGIVDLVKWANSDSRITRIIFMAAMQPNNTPLDGHWYENEHSFLWPKDPDRVCGKIDEILDLKRQGYNVGNEIFQLEAFKRYFHNPGNFVKKGKCNLDKAIHVSSVGDIYMCYRRVLLGNIKKDNLADLWYSEKADEIRKTISSCEDNCHFLLNCYFEEESFDER